MGTGTRAKVSVGAGGRAASMSHMDEMQQFLEAASVAFRKAVVEPLLPLVSRGGRPRVAGEWEVADDAASRRRLAEAMGEWDRSGEKPEVIDLQRTPIADVIRAAAEKRGITQKQIADDLGVSPAVISRVLKNPSKSKLETLQRIGKVVGVSISATQHAA